MNADTTLTIEEQREIALKIVFGICAVVAACIVVSFIRNKMTQSKTKPTKKQATNFDFLMGDEDEIAPVSTETKPEF